MIKKVLVNILKGILIFIGFILLYFLITFILSKIKIGEEKNAPDNVTVYIQTNGIHSDIVVPIITDQENWFSKVDFLNELSDTEDYKYLAFGWGDKGFYLNTPSWAELKLSTALKATVGMSGSAVHATFYKEMIESETCKKIEISTEQYVRLSEYIHKSFQSNSAGDFIKIETKANKGETDAFYEANGRYSLFNTCNSWTNRSLKASGQKACLWTAFQKPIFDKYE